MPHDACDGPRAPHRGPTQGTHTEGTHTGDPHRGPKQGTHTEERAPQRTHHRRGGPHRGPTQDTHRQNRSLNSERERVRGRDAYIQTYIPRCRKIERERTICIFCIPPNMTLICEDALVRALCPGTLRASLLRTAWRTASCAWRWRKAGSFCRALSFVFSKTELQKTVCGSWGLSPCVSSALVCNALA